jgi:hypothetical protein
VAAARIAGLHDGPHRAPRSASTASRPDVRAAETEHGLVRSPREHDGAGRAPQHAHQFHLLRVEVLRVVDQQVLHPGPLGREQLGIAGQRVQRGADQLGGVQRRRACGAARPTASRSSTTCS